MKIALALIVKGTNEEALLLDRCLDSLSPYVDGIFITRTQVEGEKKNAAVGNVAAKYNAVLSDFEWVDDFAQARNFNFAQVPEDFDWILWSDADDVWRGVEKLRDTVEKHPHTDAFGFWYLYDWDEYKKPTVVHRKTMMIRNDGCATWENAIHEDLQPNRQLDVALIEGIERLHLTTPDRSSFNAERNLRIAKKEALEKQEDPRSSWNLANALFATSDYEAALQTFNDFIEESGSNEEIYLAHIRLADVYKALGKRNEAILELQKAIGKEPTLPDAYLVLSFYYCEFGDLDKAEFYCLNGLKKRPQIMKMVVFNPRDYDYRPMMLLANIYESKNRPDLMLPLLEGCLKIYPQDKKLKEAIKRGKSDKEMLRKALTKVQQLQKIKDKVRLQKELDKLPEDLKSHPAIAVIRNTNFVKTESSGKDLVIYCGNTVETWNPELFKIKGFGGSEEAVVHLAREWAKLGWNVTVYNNCGHKPVYETVITNLGTEENPIMNPNQGVVYRPFWEWNYRDKQDVVVLWRWAKPLDAEINAPKIFLDLHDVIPEGELTEKRLKKVTKVFVKTDFHRSLFPNTPNDKFVVVGNGLDIYLDSTIEKDPYLVINTSSPDRSMDVLPKLWKEVKKQVPQARLQWAYGWNGFTSAHQNDRKKMEWMEETKKAIKDAGIEDLGRITQKEVGELYQRASYFAYPTTFAEIDCISVKKAQAAGCLPVTTNFGALAETNIYGLKTHTKVTKNTWNPPYAFHFGVKDEDEQKAWVVMMVEILQRKVTMLDSNCHDFLAHFKWSKIAERWSEEFI